MKPHLLQLLMLFCVPLQLLSQNYSINGKVNDASDSGIAFANVLVMRSADSTFVKGGVTTEQGSYVIDDIPAGNYFVQATVVGFQTATSENFNLDTDVNLPTLILREGEELGEVVVQARKPLYTQKVDRLVINVENSIVSSGGTALEVLERSPGVVVNRQNNAISVVGKEGVVVMINGKISYIPTSSLVSMLDGMSADTIESIELITTPPANFDAEGNAGYINIVLRKNANLGWNGSYSLSLGYGKGIVSNDNISFNYRKNKFNLFGSYSYLADKREQLIKTSREFRENGDLRSNSSFTERDPNQQNHGIRLGADVQLSEKTISGFILTAFDNKWTMDAFNQSMDASNGMPTGFVTLDNYEKNQLRHFGVNYNIKHDFSENEFLSMDLDYLYYEFNNPTDYENVFYDGNNMFLRTEFLQSRKETPLTTLVGKIDYSNKIGEDFKFELGAKGIKNDFENDVSVASEMGGSLVFDPTLTNFSMLDESIYAGYASADYTIDEKTSVKAGVRYEHTDSRLDVDTQGTVVDRQY